MSTTINRLLPPSGVEKINEHSLSAVCLDKIFQEIYTCQGHKTSRNYCIRGIRAIVVNVIELDIQ